MPQTDGALPLTFEVYTMKQLKAKNRKSKKTEALSPPELEVPEAKPEPEQSNELEEELALKQRQYTAQLRRECLTLRGRVDAHLSLWMREAGLKDLVGNTRQRVLREMSWTFLSLLAKPAVHRSLPCAMTGSEIYQFTHLVNAFSLTLVPSEKLPPWQESGACVTIYPLVEKARDEIEAFEARRELYTELLQLSPTEPVSGAKHIEQVTLRQVYELLLEVKGGIDEHFSNGKRSRSGKRG